MRVFFLLLVLLTSCAFGQGIPTLYSSGIPMRDGGYGASADLGWTNDPTTDATAYSAGTTYSIGDMVSSAGTYYISEKDGNVGNALTDVSAWWQVNRVCYVAAAGSDATPTSHCNATPATAKASPLQTLAGVYAVTGSGGAPPHTLILFNRGETFTGAVLLQGVLAATNFGSTGIVGNGTTATVTTTTPHWLVSGMTTTISGSTNFNVTTGAVTVIDSTHFSFPSATTATDGPNTSIKLAYNYGNFRFGAYGTGARPHIVFRDNNAIGQKQTLFWTNKLGWRMHNLVLDADFTTDVVFTGAATPSPFVVGDVVTDSNGATGTIVNAFSATRFSIKQTNTAHVFTTGHVVTSATGNSATLSSAGNYNSVISPTASDWKVQHCEIKNATGSGIIIGVAFTPGTGNNVYISDTTVHDTITIASNGAGIDQGYGSVYLDHLSVYHNGNGGSTNHGIYLNDNSYVRLTNSYIFNNSGGGYTQHGKSVKSDILNNWFDRNGAACISINDGYQGYVEYQRAVTIAGNLCTNSGHGDLGTQGLGFFLADIYSADIYDNVVAGNYGDAIRIFRNNAAPGTKDATGNVNLVANTIVVPVAGTAGSGTSGSSSFANCLNIDNTGVASTVTISIASPAVVSWTAHAMAQNSPVSFTTTGALPTGLVAGTIYYVNNPTTNTLEVSATPGGASIATNGTQSGTQRALNAPNPIAGINIIGNVLVNLGNSNTNYTDYIGYANIINTGFLEADNLHYAPNKPDGKPIYWNGTTYTLANFKAAALASSGSNSQGDGDVLGDPLFVGGSGWYDYRIQAGSPAKAMGASVTCFVSGLPCPTTDLAGQSRGTPPSAGAYQ